MSLWEALFGEDDPEWLYKSRVSETSDEDPREE